MLLRADGEVLTGEAAERRALAEPTRTGREFKRRLGDPTPIILGGTPYGAEALLAHLLRAIVERVTQQLGEAPAAIALCHPAAYSTYKLDLLQQAVRQADIGPVTLLTEPEAAALDYARQERVPLGSVIAVYDFGGGTFDATILRKTDTGFEMLGQPEGWSASAASTSTRRSSDGPSMSQGRRRDVGPERPVDHGRHRAVARRVPPRQGSPVVRYRCDHPDLPAGHPDRDAGHAG